MPIVPALLTIATASGLSMLLHQLAARHAAARSDAATALPNRLAMEEALAATPQVQLIAAMVAQFDDIASSVGVDGVTQLMLRIAERLSAANPVGQIYRLEDRVLAWDASTVAAEDLPDILDGLRAMLLHPVEVGGRRIDAKLALGVASGAGERIALVISASAAAASRALTQGENWLAADADTADAADRDLSLMGELDEALIRDEVSVHFQPKLDIRSGRIASAEALVRWNHPVRGFISPEIFVTLAERNDRIDGLTMFVIRKVLAALVASADAGNPVTIAVNISAKLLTAGKFNRELDDLLASHPDLVGRLIFEITESATMANIEAAVQAIEGYRALGIAISMDDYGTGQSTLTYIKRLPLSELKIDRSFVQHVHHNRGDAILVRSTIELAHELGLKVVAEGVEDQACLEFLAACGCDYAQGWLVSKPVPLPAFIEFVGSKTVLAA
jgi:EAL domain-containing protein (putative c-di-GMP-specific phosphodiesterase class I)/GGDEF domain-containing protein